MKKIQIIPILNKILDKLWDFKDTLGKPFRSISEDENNGFIVRVFSYGFIVIMYFLAALLIFGAGLIIIDLAIPFLFRIGGPIIFVVLLFLIPGLIIELIKRRKDD